MFCAITKSIPQLRARRYNRVYIDDYNNEYLRRTIGISAANRIYRDQFLPRSGQFASSAIRQKEEYMVVLRTDGSRIPSTTRSMKKLRARI